jgi:hypothetical protein
MPTYAGYGLTIESDIELSAFPPVSGRPDIVVDVVVREGHVQRVAGEEAREIGYTFAAPDRYYIAHEAAGCIEIAEGQRITLDLVPEAPRGIVQTLVANLAFGVLLHQRRVLTLHASAVSIGGQVVAFIGDKGWGKSTMASALYRRGHDIVTDDVLGIDAAAEGPVRARAGVPQLKLWPDAVANTLGEDPDRLERIYDQTEKRVRRVEAQRLAQQPLARIYVLGGEEHLDFHPLPPQQAFLHCMQHAYTKRILRQTESAAWHLRQVSRLANDEIVWALRRPQDLELVPEIARRVEGQIIGAPASSA